MQLYKIVFTAIIFALSSVLMIGAYILQRHKYWRRIWEELGKPEVKNVKELKSLIRKQGYPGHRGK